MTTAKTAAQRQADRKTRETAAGRVLFKHWVHPDDVPAMHAEAERLERKRLRGLKRANVRAKRV
jgi:hypothetical protein